MAKIAYVKKCPLFKDLTDKELAVLAKLMEERSYNVNSFIFEEGMQVSAFYLIKKGRIKLSRKINPGVENHPLLLLGPGQFFGELSLIYAMPKIYTAKALENVELLVLTREKFQFLSEKVPSLALKIIKQLLINTLMRWELITKNFADDMITCLVEKALSGNEPE